MDDQVKFYQNKLAYEIDSGDLVAAIRNNESIVVIDVRPPDAYQAEHIPGAINIPWKQMNAASTAHLDEIGRVVVYCDGIGCNASTKGALAMARLGFSVRELIGGLDWWKREGRKTSAGPLPQACAHTSGSQDTRHNPTPAP